MNLKERLENELHNAMRNKDDDRKRSIRMALSNIKLAEVEKRSELDDDSVIALIHKEIKICKETIEEAKKGDRKSIIEEMESEIAILQEFLPKPLSDQELQEIASGVIHELKATSLKEMGLVMKDMISKVGGRASSDHISRVVRELLQSK